MPNYTFRNKATGEEYTEFLTMAAREEFLAANPNFEQVPVNPAGLVGGVSFKPDDGFRDILREIKKVNPGSTINTY